MSKYVKAGNGEPNGSKSRNTVGIASKTTADHMMKSHGRTATSTQGYGSSSSNLIQSSKNKNQRKASDFISRNHNQQPTNTAVEATNYAQIYEMKIKESLSKGTSMLVQSKTRSSHQSNFNDLTKSKQFLCL